MIPVGLALLHWVIYNKSFLSKNIENTAQLTVNLFLEYNINSAKPLSEGCSKQILLLHYF